MIQTMTRTTFLRAMITGICNSMATYDLDESIRSTVKHDKGTGNTLMRKRSRHCDAWKANIRKLNRNAGEAYTTWKGGEQPKRMITTKKDCSKSKFSCKKIFHYRGESPYSKTSGLKPMTKSVNANKLVFCSDDRIPL